MKASLVWRWVGICVLVVKYNCKKSNVAFSQADTINNATEIVPLTSSSLYMETNIMHQSACISAGSGSTLATLHMCIYV